MTATRRSFLVSSLAGIASLQAQSPKPRHFAKFDAPARALLNSLTLEEKIGQMTQPDQSFLKSFDDIDKYRFGSILSGGDSDPKSGNDVASWTEMYENLQKRSMQSPKRIPILYGVDAVHGHNNVIGAVVFPHNVGMGCTRNAKLVEQAARITAEEIRANGINWAFAPCVTVPQDIRWGRTYEGYSENPDVVKELGEAATRGLQGSSLADPLSVLACAKHYAADGGTTFGTGMPKGPNTKDRFPMDHGDARYDEATLRRLHLQGYITSIRAGVGSIMPSYSSWNGEKCSGNKRLLTEILKDEWGFEGFLISDYNALDELPGDRRAQTAKSINAGMDMVMVPAEYQAFYTTLLSLAKDGTVPMSRIDDAVLRILKVKFAMGMMDPKRSQLADPNARKTFGSAQHKSVARQCVRESLVILKNENHALPLKKGTPLHVAGSAADDLGVQCGGWTITWQGKRGKPTEGITLLESLRKAGVATTFSADGSTPGDAKAAIAVIGEPPYAEMLGDRTDLSISAEDVALVSRLKAKGLPVIVVIFSGRPVVIDAIVDKADAIVAAWLPGTEGEGIVDVLSGAFKPKGKLAYTWPSGKSTSFARGDAGYKTLYPFGHGLTY